MGYSKEIYQAAEQALVRRRSEAQAEAEMRRFEFFSRCPQAEEIERRLSATAINAAKIVWKQGGDVQSALKDLRESNRSLEQELDALLRKEHMTPEDLQPKYSCSLCDDTGYRDGKPCDCLLKQLRTEACRKLNDTTPLGLSTFETFDLDYYPDTPGENGKNPRKHMERVFKFCKEYAENFSLKSPSLLFLGGTGLSKTHLSLAIANVVLQKGFGVVYDSVHNLMTALEKERFSRETTEDDTNQILLTCDLLILDDLGTEFRTQFTTAAVYNLVNTRLMAGRPTIISTNLSTEEMEQYYTRRFVSRVNSSYTRLPFYGRDIRQLKARERYKLPE